MPKTKTIVKKNTAQPIPQNPDLRVFALVVGIETYSGKSGMKDVQYAKNDAEAFETLLGELYADHELEIETLINTDATQAMISYKAKQMIEELEEDDLFIFYYAGHGFYDGTSERLTGSDSIIGALPTTTIRLRDVIFDPLAESPCKRSLMFIDACAETMGVTGMSRNAIDGLDAKALAKFLSPDSYCGIFLSCHPTQRSYGSAVFQHGIFTYFLIQALSGKDSDAIDMDRYVTDDSLRNYLVTKVSQHAREVQTKGPPQKPMAKLSASNRFAICRIPMEIIEIPDENDFSAIAYSVDNQFYEHTEHKDLNRLPKFKRNHTVPKYYSDRVESFVESLTSDDIAEEIQGIADETKEVFGLKHRDINQNTEFLTTDDFRYTVTAKANTNDLSEVIFSRSLEIFDPSSDTIEKIDVIFGATFDRYVAEFSNMALDFDEIVDTLEDVKGVYGGTLKVRENDNLVSYAQDGGVTIEFDLDAERLSLIMPSKEPVAKMVAIQKQFRLGGNQPKKKSLN